jgi:putative peptidoglycan lipid II flippase
MTTPGSPAGPTAADDDSAAAGWPAPPGLARPYANPGRVSGPPPAWSGVATEPGTGPGDDFGTGELAFPPGAWPAAGYVTGPIPAIREEPGPAGAGSYGSAGTTTSNRGNGAPGAGTAAPPDPAGQPAGPGQSGAGPDGPDPAQAGASSVVRSSGVMAVGTLASRVTGFLRTAVLLYALGTSFLGDAYNVANTVPNAVYNLAIGGVLTSVVVPLLVSASKRNSDRGEAYDQRIFTLGVLALAVITVVATAAAEPITAVFGHDVGDPATYHLTVVFAYFFLPQIFFYGVSSLAGAILNARGRFGAPMWTPVINNLVVIVIGGAFIALAGVDRTPDNISVAQIQLLAVGTTLGIVLQTAALVPSLRKVGFRWRPRFDFRRAEVSEIGRMGGWMLGYVLTTQVSFVVTTIVSNDAGQRACRSAACVGAGYAAYSNAWQLFQLPYAIVGISVITAMLPRMSAHAAAGSYGLVREDFSGASRLASVIVVPAALVLAVLGAPLAEALFSYGSTSVVSARYLGEVFAVFSLGLLPYMLFQLQLRVFYAMHDSRTPALIGVGTMTVNVLVNLLALAVLPPRDVTVGLGVGFGLANLAGTVAAWRVLGRRVGGLDGHRVGSALLRMHLSALPAAIFAIAVTVMVGVILPAGRLGAAVTMILAGAGALLLYVMFARALRVRELTDLTGTVLARFRR